MIKYFEIYLHTKNHFGDFCIIWRGQNEKSVRVGYDGVLVTDRKINVYFIHYILELS